MKNRKSKAKDPVHTVGLVDDHVLVRSALAGLINTLGGYVVVLEAENGFMLEQILTNVPAPELIILDVNMPLMDGFETCDMLARDYPAVKVLALSMHSEESVIIRMIQAGAKGYLLKSADPLEIRKALDTLLRNDFYLPSTISERIVLGLGQNNVEEEEIDADLNEKELEFLKLICSEMSHKEISNKMNVSKRTVDYYRDGLFRKLNTKTRVGLVRYAIEHGLI